VLTTAPSPEIVGRHVGGRAGFGVVLIIGIALRARQLFEQAPLWLDELALVNGILAGPFSAVFDGPSDFAQVAPPGFVALEWLLVQAFPSADLLLRVPAFVAACAALWLTWLAACEMVGERDAWIAAALVALAGPLVFMAGQVKPYAADAFFAALLLACLLRHDRLHTRRTFLTLLLAGVLAPLFSFGAVFMLAGAGAFLLCRTPWRSLEWRPLLLTFAAWGGAALVSMVLTSRLVNPATERLMQDYWATEFPPPGWSSLSWLVDRVQGLLWNLMGLRGVRVIAVALVVSGVIAWRQKPAWVVMLFAPFLAAVGAAALHEYPFGVRLLHWTAPVVALLLTLVVSRLTGLILHKRVFAALPALALLSGPASALWLAPPPYLRDDVRPIVTALSSRARPGDVLYVYWGAWHAWQRYGPRVTSAIEVDQGGCPIDYPRGFLRDLDRHRGRSGVWILFGRMQYEEEHRMLLDYMNTIGQRTDSVVVESRGLNLTPRMDLHRFDLSDPALLARADAETFPIPADFARRATGCPRIDAMLLRGNGARVVRLF
jgi:hypothetical protein